MKETFVIAMREHHKCPFCFRVNCEKMKFLIKEFYFLEHFLLQNVIVSVILIKFVIHTVVNFFRIFIYHMYFA